MPAAVTPAGYGNRRPPSQVLPTSDPLNVIRSPTPIPGRRRDPGSEWFVDSQYLEATPTSAVIDTRPAMRRGSLTGIGCSRRPLFRRRGFYPRRQGRSRHRRADFSFAARFVKLGLFKNTPELFAFAPWFHPAVEREPGTMTRYLGSNGEFPGGLGLTESAVSVSPSCARWASALPTGELLPEAIDAWRLRFDAEAQYVRDLIGHRFPAVPQGEPWDLEFDARFLVLETQVRHEFRF
eukprot:IDg23347t1